MRLRLAALLLAPALAAAQLPGPVREALARAGVPESAVGAVVEPVASGKPLVAHQADKPLNPASTIKLLTTYSALDLLGPAYTFKTDVLVTGERGRRRARGRPRPQGRRRPQAHLRAPVAAGAPAARARAARDPRRRDPRPLLLRPRRARSGEVRRRVAPRLQRRARRPAPELQGRRLPLRARRGGRARDRRARLSERADREPREAREGALQQLAARAQVRDRGERPPRDRRLLGHLPGRLRREGLGAVRVRRRPLRRGRLPLDLERDGRALHRQGPRRRRAGRRHALPPLRVRAAGRARARHQQVLQQRDGAAALPHALGGEVRRAGRGRGERAPRARLARGQGHLRAGARDRERLGAFARGPHLRRRPRGRHARGVVGAGDAGARLVALRSTPSTAPSSRGTATSRGRRT